MIQDRDVGVQILGRAGADLALLDLVRKCAGRHAREAVFFQCSAVAM